MRTLLMNISIIFSFLVLISCGPGHTVEVEFISNNFALYQNSPNPFNPSTIIKYIIPSTGTSLMTFVQLKVYDVLGNEVATLVNEEKAAGTYEVDFSTKGGSASGGNAIDLSSGIYFYKIKAGEFTVTKKMILLR